MHDAISSRDIELDTSVFGGTPGIPGAESLSRNDTPVHEVSVSQEYFVENKVSGLPVCERDRQLAIRGADDIESLFTPVSNVHTICFKCTPDMSEEDKALVVQYDTVLSAAENGTMTVIHNDRTFDPSIHGYIVMLTYSVIQQELKPEFRNSFSKLEDITGVNHVE